MILTDQDYLKQCLALAYKGKGECAPNPAVGAVIVQQQQVVGVGYHARAGEPHAEVHALNAAGSQARQATLYVTLEPCCHVGRTPACTQAIIRAGVKRVVYAYIDPNPQVGGQGAEMLQRAAIECDYLPLDEIAKFYQSYHYWQQTHLPWISAKLALSKDLKIAGQHGARVNISGDVCALFTHQKRLYSDAILSTAVTLNQDNPQMNVRLDDKRIKKSIFIIDRELTLQADLQLYHTAKSITLFHQQVLTPRQKLHRQQLEKLGITCVSMPVDNQQLRLTAIWDYIGQSGVHDLWIEAGARLFNALVDGGHVQQAYIYQAPHALGSQAKSAQLNLVTLLTACKDYTITQAADDEIYELYF